MTKWRILGIFLIIVSLGTIVVSVVSYSILPILPTNFSEPVIIVIAAFVGVVGILAGFNDALEFVHKFFNGHDREGQSSHSQSLGIHSLSIYPHRNRPYNAAKMIYTGSEVAKDFRVELVYKDTSGDLQTKAVTDFFPKQDSRMIWYHHKYDFLEPNQVTYFHLIKKKTTLDGRVTVVASFVGAASGESVKIKREFVLEDF